MDTEKKVIKQLELDLSVSQSSDIQTRSNQCSAKIICFSQSKQVFDRMQGETSSVSEEVYRSRINSLLSRYM